MKKFYYILGAFVTAATIFALIAIMLKKIKVSLAIEGVDDITEDENEEDITLTIENDDIDDSDVTIKKEIETMLDEEI